MLTAVLDTNVLASGFVRPGSLPAALLALWGAGSFRLAVSERILSELRHVFEDPYFRTRVSDGLIQRDMALLGRNAVIMPIARDAADQASGVATHPEDDLILATAVSARADYLVTGDKKLQQLGSYQGVCIVSPRQFYELLEQATPGD